MDDIDRNGSRHTEHVGSGGPDRPDEYGAHDAYGEHDEHDEPRSPSVLSALLWSLATAALLFGAGYAAFRWASTGMPLSPQPGSPWAYLATWSAFCLVGCLLLRWATVTEDGEGTGYVALVIAFAGVRLSLAHRPDLDLLWAWAVPALLLGTAAALAWRRRKQRA